MQLWRPVSATRASFPTWSIGRWMEQNLAHGLGCHEAARTRRQHWTGNRRRPTGRANAAMAVSVECSGSLPCRNYAIRMKLRNIGSSRMHLHIVVHEFTVSSTYDTWAWAQPCFVVVRTCEVSSEPTAVKSSGRPRCTGSAPFQQGVGVRYGIAHLVQGGPSSRGPSAAHSTAAYLMSARQLSSPRSCARRSTCPSGLRRSASPPPLCRCRKRDALHRSGTCHRPTLRSSCGVLNGPPGGLEGHCERRPPHFTCRVSVPEGSRRVRGVLPQCQA